MLVALCDVMRPPQISMLGPESSPGQAPVPGNHVLGNSTKCKRGRGGGKGDSIVHDPADADGRNSSTKYSGLRSRTSAMLALSPSRCAAIAAAARAGSRASIALT